MENIQFYRGPRVSYDETAHVDGIYFATDTQEVLMNGKSYGGGIADASYANNIITLTMLDGSTKTITLPEASSSVDGLMTKEDKVRVDGIFAGNLDLPTPTITGTWTFQNKAGLAVAASAISPTPNADNPVLETGYKANFTGTFKWIHVDGKKDPTLVASDSNWTTLPASNTNSDSYSTGFVTSNRTVRASIQAAKTGLMCTETAVKGTTISVVPASGMDIKSAAKTVSFKSRLYFGYSTTNAITEDILKGFTDKNVLQTSRAITKTGITADTSQYFVYAYPESLGALTGIIQDGATPVLGAFTHTVLNNFTNDAGHTFNLHVYVSNNRGAFTNSKLAFS